MPIASSAAASAAAPRDDAPARRGQPAVREEQQDEERQRGQRRERPVREPRRRLAERRASRRRAPPARSRRRAPATPMNAPKPHEDPADRVRRLPRRDEPADDRRGDDQRGRSARRTRRRSRSASPTQRRGSRRTSASTTLAADGRPREPRGAPAAHGRASFIQIDTCAGCIVSPTTRPRSAVSALELDLLAQPRAERLERALGVVAAPVEAPVDEPLHARPQRQEQRGDDERRDGDRQVRAARERREHRLPGEHERDVAGAEQRGHATRTTSVRLISAVDVVEAVAQHRGRGGEPDGRDHDRHDHRPDVDARAEGEDGADEEAERGDERAERQPLELLALAAGRAAEAQRRSRRRRRPTQAISSAKPIPRSTVKRSPPGYGLSIG